MIITILSINKQNILEIKHINYLVFNSIGLCFNTPIAISHSNFISSLSSSQSFQNDCIHSSDGLIRRAMSAKSLVAAHFVDFSGRKFAIFNTFPPSFKGGSRVH